MGVGQCEVVCHDEPSERRFGFDLTQTKDGLAKWWGFTIGISSWKASPLLIRETLSSLEGRCRVARLLQEGVTPEALETHPSLGRVHSCSAKSVVPSR